MHLVAQFLDFGVVSGPYPLLAFERRSWVVWPWACLRPCPAPRPRGRRAARARGSLRRTLAARPALAVTIPAPSLLARRLGRAGANGKSGREAAAVSRPNNSDICPRFPLVTDRTRSSAIVSAALPIRRELTLSAKEEGQFRKQGGHR